MAFNPSNEKHLRRLWRAAEYFYGQLSFQRIERQDALRRLVGTHFSKLGADERVAINIIEMWRGIYSRLLIPRLPQVMCTPREGHRLAELGPEAYTEQIAMNRMLKDIRLEETLRAAVDEALLSFGQCRVGVEDGGEVFDPETGASLGRGVKEFVEPITLEHWVHDLSAERWSQVTFGGNRSRIPLEDAREEESWDKDVRESLTATDAGERTFAEEHRGSELTMRRGQNADEFEQHVEYWDFFVPSGRDWHGKGYIITMASNGRAEALARIETPFNPYIRLSYGDVPSNTLPLPPVAASILDLEELVNRLFNKSAEQALRQKRIGTGKGTPEQLKQLRDADDGEIVPGLRDLGEQSYGGASPEILVFTQQVRAMLDELAGHLSLLGGGGASSPTATQDTLLLGQANKRIEDMQDRTYAFTKEIVERLADYQWDNPLRSVRVSKPIPGMDASIPADELTAFNRKGARADYLFDIDPYSAMHTTPQSKMAAVVQLTDKLLQAMAMVGGGGLEFDLNEYKNVLSKLANVPEIDRMFRPAPTGVPQPQNEGAQPPGGFRPPQTNRTYTRTTAPVDAKADREHDATMGLLKMAGAGANGR